MSFGFVQNWRQKIIDDPLDTRMTETMQLGIRTAQDRVHVVTGFLKSTIGGHYNKSTKTIQVYADAKYSWVEEMRPPLGSHSYLLPAMQAMAGFWGGRSNLVAAFPNAAPKGKSTTIESLREREAGWKKKLGFMTRFRGKVSIQARRWHRRMDELETTDPSTPLI
jgi:hypothetical protein